jgi:hypothetical protein
VVTIKPPSLLVESRARCASRVGGRCGELARVRRPAKPKHNVVSARSMSRIRESCVGDEYCSLTM